MQSILQLFRKYTVGLVCSIVICISCIVLILEKQDKGVVWGLEKDKEILGTGNASLSTVDAQRLKQIRDGGQGQGLYTGVEKAVHIITTQSEKQRHTMQVRNTENDFHPEMLITKYFKTFNGDTSSLQK